MNKIKQKNQKQELRHKRVRAKITGTQLRPRLCVSRTDKHIYAQIIDDQDGKTLAAASDIKETPGNKMERAMAVGKQIAEAAKAAGVTKVAFDRSGYKYHGRVKALAESAREGGLEF